MPDEIGFRKAYHPLFDKYNVDFTLQGQHLVYERMYPILLLMMITKINQL